MYKNHQSVAPEGGAKMSNRSESDRVEKQYFPFSEPHPGPHAGHEEIIDTHVRPETFL